MTGAYELVADTIAVAGGEIVGRVRLQKVFYLLEEIGLKSDLKFAYHHYGPYSRELDEALDAAKAFTPVKEEVRRRQSDGAPFSVFIIPPDAPRQINGHLGELATSDARAYIEEMKSVSSTVIELAATIHWLVHREGFSDWRSELRKRKGVKTEGGRTEQALSLLQKLNLGNAIAA